MVRLTRLKRRRLEKGWSLDDLARESGFSRQALGRLERGLSEPRPATITRLADMLECKAADLMEPEGG